MKGQPCQVNRGVSWNKEKRVELLKLRTREEMAHGVNTRTLKTSRCLVESGVSERGEGALTSKARTLAGG